MFCLFVFFFCFLDLGGALKPRNRGFVIEECFFFLLIGIMPDQKGPTPRFKKKNMKMRKSGIHVYYAQ